MGRHRREVIDALNFLFLGINKILADRSKIEPFQFWAIEILDRVIQVETVDVEVDSGAGVIIHSPAVKKNREP